MQAEGKGVSPPVHRSDAVGCEVIVKRGGAALVESDQKMRGCSE